MNLRNLVTVTIDQKGSEGLGEVVVEGQVVVMVSSDVECVLFISTVLVDPVHDDTNRVINIEHSPKHIVHVVGVGSPVDISLFVHQEETIVVLAQKFQGGLDIVLDLGDVLELFGRIVVAKILRSSDIDTNGKAGVGVDDTFRAGAPAVGIGGVNSTVGHVGLTTGSEIPSDADQKVITIIGVQAGDAVVKVL